MGRTRHIVTSRNNPAIVNGSPYRKAWDRLQRFVSNTVSIDTSKASIYWLPVIAIDKLFVLFYMQYACPSNQRISLYSAPPAQVFDLSVCRRFSAVAVPVGGTGSLSGCGCSGKTLA